VHLTEWLLDGLHSNGVERDIAGKNSIANARPWEIMCQPKRSTLILNFSDSILHKHAELSHCAVRPTLLPGLLNWLMEIMRCTRLTLPSRRTYLQHKQNTTQAEQNLSGIWRCDVQVRM
jgi:hypothetical protein